MTKKISEIAYNRLKEEYEGELEDVKNSMGIQKDFERIFKAKLDIKKKKLEEELEVLKAKLEIKELSEQDFQVRSSAAQKELEDTELILSNLVL